MAFSTKKKISPQAWFVCLVAASMGVAVAILIVSDLWFFNSSQGDWTERFVSVSWGHILRGFTFSFVLLTISWIARRFFGLSVGVISADFGGDDRLSERHKRIQAEASARLAELNEMATSIAHEINNPLAIISGYNHVIKMELTRSPPRFDKVYKAADSVDVTINRMAKIISSLRAYARDGSQDPMVTSSVVQIIDDAVAMADSRLKSYGIEIRVNSTTGCELQIKCRKVQIVQVIVSLIHNAVDAVKESPELWIEIGIAKMGHQVKLTMTDSGLGIRPDIARRVFEPFFTTKQVGHGPGLGLSVAYGIIKGHGGEIYLDQASKNTRFVIELPLANSSVSDHAA